MSLWQILISTQSLRQGWERVRANAGCAGGDGQTLEQFAQNLGRRLDALSQALRCGEYQPRQHRFVDIPKKKGGTRRLVIPSVQDRVVLSAIAQSLDPILDPEFHDGSFAYRQGRSVKQAVEKVVNLRNAGYTYVVEADIVNFFDQVRHETLLEKLDTALAAQPGGSELVDLIALILEHQALETGTQGKGVAQGSPLSPLLANLYLDALDKQIQQQGAHMVRFADDFIILCKRERTAQAALARAQRVLHHHGLEMHEGGTRVHDFERGFEFLGHLFVRSFALQQVNDPEENPVELLKALGREDQAERDRALTQDAEAKAGFDRGDRVLYVLEQGRSLGLRNLSFVVRSTTDKELVAIAHRRVDRIEVGPQVAVSRDVIDHCVGTQTELVFVDDHGEVRSRLHPPRSEAAQMLQRQVLGANDPAFALAVARRLVAARIRNQRTQLFRLNRRAQKAEVTQALKTMGRHLGKVKAMGTIEAVRGLEGAVAALYWPALGLLCEGAQAPFRRIRPATDALNAALNYMGALLQRDINAAISHTHLHPGIGFLHRVSDQTEGLVYDFMDIFRAPLVEGAVVYLFNARRLRPDMFMALPDDGIRIASEGRRALIKHYEQALAKRIKAPNHETKLAWRPLMRRQVQDLALAFRQSQPDLFTPYLMEA